MNDLTLCIVNDGRTYQHRLALARQQRESTDPTLRSPSQIASAWSVHACAAASEALRKGHHVYTVQDILTATVELADYYAEHIKEVDAS